jgi:ribosome maturation factor RimP
MHGNSRHGSPRSPTRGAAADAERIVGLLEPAVAAMGMDLEDVRITSAGRRRLLRIVVDADGGVSLDDIALVSRELSATLDRAAAMGEASYTLEVSSPGVDRPLTEPKHWRRAVGRMVTAPLRAVPGRRPAQAPAPSADPEGRPAQAPAPSADPEGRPAQAPAPSADPEGRPAQTPAPIADPGGRTPRTPPLQPGSATDVPGDSTVVTGRVTGTDSSGVRIDVDGASRVFGYSELGPGRIQIEFAPLDAYAGDGADEEGPDGY